MQNKCSHKGTCPDKRDGDVCVNKDMKCCFLIADKLEDEKIKEVYKRKPRWYEKYYHS